ncbi:MAG: FAD-binding oxidoreductase [Desulfobacteraceae bacterium]
MMRNWNGWGDDTLHMDVPPPAVSLLKKRIGKGTRTRGGASLQQLLARVPSSRLGDHSLVNQAPFERLSHAHGQSMPDWIGLRWGTLNRFPDGVAYPTSGDELQEVLEFGRSGRAMIIPYGGGTSVVGHLSVPDTDQPVLSLSLERLNRLVHLDVYSRLATLEAGVTGPDLEAQLRAHGMTLGHYPQSFQYSTLGGWVATRSSGQQSSHYGRIEDLFAGGEIHTPRGVWVCPPFPASAAGPDLRHLILGSEGRLGIVHRAVVRVSPLPERDEVYGLFFPSWRNAVRAVRAVAGAGIPYAMVRLSNTEETLTQLLLAGKEKAIRMLERYLRLRKIEIPPGVMGLMGFIGSRAQVRTARREALSMFRRYQGVSVGRPMGAAWQKNRFKAPYLRNTLWNLGYAADTVETAVPWVRVTRTMTAMEAAVRNSLRPFNEKVHVFSHLSHVYATGSSVYTTFLFRLGEGAQETLARWKAIKTAASRAIVKAGGTISHQHGVGTDHRDYLSAEKGRVGMDLLHQVITHMDPEVYLNPGKLIGG